MFHSTYSFHSFNIVLQVLSADNSAVVGKLTKQWVISWMKKTVQFRVSFPPDLDVRMKAALIAACILIVCILQKRISLDFYICTKYSKYARALNFNHVFFFLIGFDTLQLSLMASYYNSNAYRRYGLPFGLNFFAIYSGLFAFSMYMH